MVVRPARESAASGGGQLRSLNPFPRSFSQKAALDASANYSHPPGYPTRRTGGGGGGGGSAFFAANPAAMGGGGGGAGRRRPVRASRSASPTSARA